MEEKLIIGSVKFAELDVPEDEVSKLTTLEELDLVLLELDKQTVELFKARERIKTLESKVEHLHFGGPEELRRITNLQSKHAVKDIYQVYTFETNGWRQFRGNNEESWLEFQTIRFGVNLPLLNEAGITREFSRIAVNILDMGIKMKKDMPDYCYDTVVSDEVQDKLVFEYELDRESFLDRSTQYVHMKLIMPNEKSIGVTLEFRHTNNERPHKARI